MYIFDFSLVVYLLSTRVFIHIESYIFVHKHFGSIYFHYLSGFDSCVCYSSMEWKKKDVDLSRSIYIVLHGVIQIIFSYIFFIFLSIYLFLSLSILLTLWFVIIFAALFFFRAWKGIDSHRAWLQQRLVCLYSLIEK